MAISGDLLWDQMSCTLLGNTMSRGGGSWIATGPCGSPRRMPSRRSSPGSVRISTSRRFSPGPITSRWPGISPSTETSPPAPGELCYLATDENEPPGKPIAACKKVTVRLELATREDRELLGTKGLAFMRRNRLARLARQARVQGGLLTVEDLAYLTCSSPATVKRDLAACRAEEIAVPTRGQIKDIGPGLTHKAKIIQLYLWGLQFTDIESRTQHSEGSIRRYLADFRQVAALHIRGATVPEIRAATGRSASLIVEYIGIYERARQEFPSAPRLSDLLDPALAKKGGPR